MAFHTKLINGYIAAWIRLCWSALIADHNVFGIVPRAIHRWFGYLDNQYGAIGSPFQRAANFRRESHEIAQNIV
jgi:hypothetical protein